MLNINDKTTFKNNWILFYTVRIIDYFLLFSF